MKHELSFKRKLSISFLLFYLLPLLTVIVIGYSWISNTMISQTITGHRTILDKARQQVDNNLTGLADYTTQLSQRTWLNSIAYLPDLKQSRFDNVDYANFTKEIFSFVSSNGLTGDAFLYLENSQSVLTTISSTAEPLDWFIENSFVVDFFLNKNPEANISAPVVPQYEQLSEVSSYGRKRSGVLCQFPVLSNVSYSAVGSLNFFVPYTELKKLISESLSDELQLFTVSDNNGVFLSNDKLLSEIDTHEFESKDEIVLFDEKHYCVTSTSNKTGWVYTSFIPQSVILGALKNIKFVVILGTIVFCALGFFLTYYMTLNNYRPVQDLINKISENGLFVKNKTNELNWLDGAIKSILDKNHNLSNQITAQRPILRNAYISWLLTDEGQKDKTQALASIELLGMDFPYDFFVCIISSSKVGNLLLNDIDTLTNKLKISLYPFDKDGETVFILNYTSQEQLNDFINEFSGVLHLKDKKYYFGVSEPCRQIDELSHCYKQAKISRNFRVVNEEGGLSLFSEINASDGSYYYPIEKEYAIKNCLKSGDYQNAMGVFNELLEQNSKEHPILPNRIKNFFYNVQFTCLKCIEELKIKEKVNVNIEQIMYCDTLDSFTENIKRSYSAICEYVNSNKKDYHVSLKHDICSFIDNNLCDKMLSLSMISERFDLSDSYVSKLFKEQIGVNFLDYINHERINLAKKLLIDYPSKSVSDIGLEIGYENDATFRRVFKKYEGITPTAFKETM